MNHGKIGATANIVGFHSEPRDISEATSLVEALLADLKLFGGYRADGADILALENLARFLRKNKNVR